VPWGEQGPRSGELDAGSPPADEELPETLPREVVRDALRKVAPFVAQCSRGESGEVRVFLEVSGATGQVKEATVAKRLAGTEVARCVEGVVLQAQFPRFRRKSLTVTFPFALPPQEPVAGAGAADGRVARDGG